MSYYAFFAEMFSQPEVLHIVSSGGASVKKRIPWGTIYLTISFFVITTAYVGSNIVTVMSETDLPERPYIIVIDAGHGGEDGGSISIDGLPESNFNLSIALRLEKIFQFLGMETRMVRDRDISVYTEGTTLAQKKRSDLKNRVNIVNESEKNILLSIHQNSYPDSRYYGAQVFYANTEGSKALAAVLQSAIRSALNPGGNREIKPAAGIYLMEHIQRPGVLIECGFLSNPQESQLLEDSEYQKKIACVLAIATKNHLAPMQ